MEEKTMEMKKRFTAVKKLGEGTWSEVWLVKDKETGQNDILKILHKNRYPGRICLPMEKEKLMALDYPLIPAIKEISEDQGLIYLLMDYIEGQPLDQYMYAFGAQKEERVILWMKEIAGALDYLHQQKPPVIHRDVKPSNLILCPDGNVKLIDFGIAKERELSYSGCTELLGTRGYAAPEQYQGNWDERTDIYGLGMTAFYLLTGENPEEGRFYRPIRRCNPELSEDIEAIVDRCVQTDKEKRYSSCLELLYDLSHPGKGRKKETEKRKMKTFLIAAGMAIALLLSGLCLRFASGEIKDRKYDALVWAVDSPESYMEAVVLEPGRTDAYFRLLEYYESQGRFGTSESQAFLSLYNRNKEMLEGKRYDVAELNYKAGQMYFNLYGDPEEEQVLSLRIQKAYPFFRENYNYREELSGFSKEKLSCAYYFICDFYKKYILVSSTISEPTENAVKDLFQTAENAMELVQEEEAYDRLVLYNSLFMLVYDQRFTFASSGEVKGKPERLLEKIYNLTAELKVKNRQSEELKKEIMENYRPYRKAVIHAGEMEEKDSHD